MAKTIASGRESATPSNCGKDLLRIGYRSLRESVDAPQGNLWVW
jgi:hypothetical protein